MRGFFFFSSRRRHTRCGRDWSSDVCSSDLWQDGARARGVSIEVEDRLAGATTVGGNAAALREAVTNLVLNAIDAMPKGGRLTLETRIDGDHAVLVVADTGIGMSESVRLKAHEPFLTTKGLKATGPCLSVA